MEQVEKDYIQLCNRYQDLIEEYNLRMKDIESRNEEIRQLKAYIQNIVNSGVKLLD